MKRSIAFCLILPILACASTTQFVTNTRATLDYINAAYQAADTWYMANQSQFTPDEQRKIMTLKADYVFSYNTLRAALDAYEAGQAGRIDAMIANLITIAFDVILLIRAHSTPSKSLVNQPQLSINSKKALLIQLGKEHKNGQ